MRLPSIAYLERRSRHEAGQILSWWDREISRWIEHLEGSRRARERGLAQRRLRRCRELQRALNL